jgi:branched-chain amino acid aminotransferase
MLIYIDGAYYPRELAKVSVFDHGLLYGDGVFEGIRAYDGRVFELDAHVERLYDSAKVIGLAIPLDRREMAAAILETVRRNELRDAYVRLVVTRGEGDLGLNPAKCAAATVIIIAATIQLYPEDVYRTGLTVKICQTRRTSSQCVSPAVKSLNYLNNIMAALELRGTGAHEGLMLTLDGYVCECTADNFFMVKSGRLLTPSLAVGALRGVTRGVVMRLAREMDLDVEEGLFTPYDVYTADEAFLTGTGAEVAPVVQVDLRTIGDGTPGPITHELIQRFRAHAGRSGTAVYPA